jgi:hypothetical protein
VSHAQRDKKIGTTPSPQWTFSESVQILTSMRLETPSPVSTATCDNLTVIAVTRNFEGRYNYSEDEMNREENQRVWLWHNCHVAFAKQHNLFKLPVLGLRRMVAACGGILSAQERRRTVHSTSGRSRIAVYDDVSADEKRKVFLKERPTRSSSM